MSDLSKLVEDIILTHFPETDP